MHSIIQSCIPLFVTATAVIPVSVNVVMLSVVMFLMGVTFGALNNGKYIVYSECAAL